MPRKTTFRRLAAAHDDAPQQRHVDHALDLAAAAAAEKSLQAQQQMQRVEEAKPLRSGGAFANTPADQPQRPQQRSAAPVSYTHLTLPTTD